MFGILNSFLMSLKKILKLALDIYLTKPWRAIKMEEKKVQIRKFIQSAIKHCAFSYIIISYNKQANTFHLQKLKVKKQDHPN